MAIADNIATGHNVKRVLQSTCDEANLVSLAFIVDSTENRDFTCVLRAAMQMIAAAALNSLASDYNQIASAIH